MKIKIKPKIQCFLVLYGEKPSLYTEKKEMFFTQKLLVKSTNNFKKSQVTELDMKFWSTQKTDSIFLKKRIPIIFILQLWHTFFPFYGQQKLKCSS